MIVPVYVLPITLVRSVVIPFFFPVSFPVFVIVAIAGLSIFKSKSMMGLAALLYNSIDFPVLISVIYGMMLPI